ncbi:uncharacterized protein VNE69_11018 [Vairimorpha necatrix]|uniref:Uncharacterized protein n=1 Tax=Vairimorpha necatrix TaxID=6039 RepID=A0AAX4JFT0_9MICR
MNILSIVSVVIFVKAAHNIYEDIYKKIMRKIKTRDYVVLNKCKKYRKINLYCEKHNKSLICNVQEDFLYEKKEPNTFGFLIKYYEDKSINDITYEIEQKIKKKFSDIVQSIHIVVLQHLLF